MILLHYFVGRVEAVAKPDLYSVLSGSESPPTEYKIGDRNPLPQKSLMLN